jgi:hypothetical protein
VLVVPVVLLHRHYDNAIADLSDKLARYRRVAAQAPELRQALESVKAKDGRRFYLQNTAANLAAAELQETVKAAIENNGGRITTSQNTATREDGRFRQIGVNVQFFATTPALQKILTALEAQQPYVVIDNIAMRPLNAFRGFKPGPGQEPELNLQLGRGKVGGGVVQVEAAAVARLHRLERGAQLRRLRGDAAVALETVGEIGDRLVVMAMQQQHRDDQHRGEHGERDQHDQEDAEREQPLARGRHALCERRCHWLPSGAPRGLRPPMALGGVGTPRCSAGGSPGI